MRLLATGVLTLTAAAGLAPYIVFLHLRRRHDRLQRVLAWAVVRLAEFAGPVGIKLAQIASARGDLLPPIFVDALGQVQDQVRPPSTRAIRRALGQAYGASLTSTFPRLDLVPVASGSIAVVLRAYTRDGDHVALKIVRPGVSRRLAGELRWLRRIVTLIGRRPRFQYLPLVQTFDIFAGLVVRQVDMKAEAEAALRVAEMLGNDVIVPRPRLDLTHPGVLVMTYHAPRYKISDAWLPAEEYRLACRTLLRAVYRMTLIHGYVHGDLHPGNVGIADDGRIILYDFGLIAALSPHDRVLFRDFFLAVACNDGATVARCILVSARRQMPAHGVAPFRRDVDLVLRRRSGQRAGEFLVAGFVRELFALQHRHGLDGTPGFAAAIWALGMFEGLVRERYPDLDFQREVRPFVTSAILERVRPI
jgi:ubiquinone biosynthesis protein